MKRCLVRIFAFLLLGAIVNIAVAWGFAVFGRVVWSVSARSIDPPGSPYQGCSGRIDTWSGGGRRITMWLPLLSTSGIWQDVRFDTELPAWAIVVRPREGEVVLDDAFGPRARVVQGTGWPCCAMMGGFECGPRTGRIVNQWSAFFIRAPNKNYPWADDDTRLLPLMPIWPGFAINTVFYALGGWLLFAGPFVVRRWRRIRRGLCPKCAYDLRGTTGMACPECGEPLTRKV